MSRTLTADPFGSALRTWRTVRRMSQLDLASVAGVSTRHLSFIETGRAKPSREMVVHLAEQLEVPNRERNTLLVAAGFAPLYSETPIDAPEMDTARAVIAQLLETHPYPAIAVGPRRALVNGNPAAFAFIEGVDDERLGPPLNLYRITLHPKGLQPRVVNFDEYAAHMVARLQQQVALSADPELAALLDEVRGYVGNLPASAHLPTAQVLLP